MSVESQLPGLVASAGIIPYYREFSIVLTAGQDYTLFKVGDAFNVIDLSGACTLSINDGDATPARAGIGYKLPRGTLFNRIRVKETAGAACTITLGIAYGEIQDNRASFAGNQSVQNAAIPNDELQVKTKVGTTLAAALASGDAGIAALIAALREANQLRAPMTTLAGATYSTRTNEAAEQTIVTGVTNTNGIIVRRAIAVTDGGAAADGYFGAGAGQPFIGVKPNPGTDLYSDLSNLFIPAGVALVSKFTSAFNFGFIWYQTL
jgi:hypothetical protein